ncbi:hypothetical protein [Candidatus Ruminimicrobium bovinum]|uniref:hypothetical protein n=1 Tax=Candidatus Ruminimicrobium bovinum TaxID=3242779 RepID=UPI0039B82263
MKRNKVMKMVNLFVCITLLCVVTLGLVSCSDPDSDGSYVIDVAGHEDERRETIYVTNANDSLKANVNGSIYAEGNTYRFESQEITLAQKAGDLWYARVRCTDGIERVIYAVRHGAGTYLTSGSVNIAGYGCGFSYIVYDEYDSVNYLSYAGYDYLK